MFEFSLSLSLSVYIYSPRQPDPSLIGLLASVDVKQPKLLTQPHRTGAHSTPRPPLQSTDTAVDKLTRVVSFVNPVSLPLFAPFI